MNTSIKVLTQCPDGKTTAMKSPQVQQISEKIQKPSKSFHFRHTGLRMLPCIIHGFVSLPGKQVYPLWKEHGSRVISILAELKISEMMSFKVMGLKCGGLLQDLKCHAW
ncbi:hypothetical protein AMECASPLE_021089 [Ameca splendens]|uniref:Uncharacterized protein n=1 Tax=Ameca splendens TaxID=208324 RepID=A0ABV0ZZ45_9TELE